jgi:hypothetical protein
MELLSAVTDGLQVDKAAIRLNSKYYPGTVHNTVRQQASVSSAENRAIVDAPGFT